MLSQNQIKHLQSLSQKKFRNKHELFIAEGDKIVTEVLSSHYKPTKIYALEDWFKQKSIAKDIDCIVISEKELQRISTLTTPNQALALVKIPEELKHNTPLPHQNLILALDRIQDPGNLGTIIRTADWFGIDHIVCSHDCADIYNPKVIQASMGSFARVKLYYTNLNEYLNKQDPDTAIWGATLDGENLYNASLPHCGVLIMGNESKGISSEIQDLLNFKLYIPLSKKTSKASYPESLNVATATAILLSTYNQQKHALK